MTHVSNVELLCQRDSTESLYYNRAKLLLADLTSFVILSKSWLFLANRDQSLFMRVECVVQNGRRVK